MPSIDASPSTTSIDAGRARAPRIVFFQAGSEVVEVVYASPFDVRVEGLLPDDVVTISSSARFRADDQGVVQLSRDAPLDGSYGGVDPDGLVWSMRRESQENGNSFAVTFVVSSEDEELARATLARAPMGADATRVPLREQGLFGTLYVPPGDAPHAALLVLGGSEGGTPSFTAAYLASMGYATLALAYFGEPGLPAELRDVPLEYFDRALDWLAARDEVDATRLGVVGGSRGGELALLIASRRDDLDVVIAQVPSGLVHGAVGGDGAAWSERGEPVAWLALPADARLAPEMLPGGQTGYRGTPAIEAALAQASAEELERVSIPVERSSAAILLVGAEDDGVWPSCALMAFAWARLETSGHVAAHGDERVCLPNAGHGVSAPGWPTEESYAVPAFGAWLVRGGTAEGDGRGAREQDTRIRRFLAAHL